MVTKVSNSIEPDWDFWLAMPEVDLWEAIALSLDIDPHNISIARGSWMSGPGGRLYFESSSFPDENIKQIFDKRQRLLLAYISNRGHFSAGKLSIDIPNRRPVRLSEFAAWALLFAKPIPKKLAALAPIPAVPVISANNQSANRPTIASSGGPGSLPSIGAALDQSAADAGKPEPLWRPKARTLAAEFQTANPKIKRDCLADNVREALTATLGIGKVPSAETIRRHAFDRIIFRSKSKRKGQK